MPVPLEASMQLKTKFHELLHYLHLLGVQDTEVMNQFKVQVSAKSYAVTVLVCFIFKLAT